MNIILIGMSGSGKTEIARHLGKILNKSVLDTDCMVSDETGMPIPDLFAVMGEAAFRRLESEACVKAAQQAGVVISTGGGAPLLSENTAALKQTGKLFFIDRAPELIFKTADRSIRPMLQNEADFLRIYRLRLPVYRRIADYIISNNGDIDQAVNRIVQIYQRFI